MAEPIRPKDLPVAPNVPGDAAIIIDNGIEVQQATPEQILGNARPFANQAEAQAGADNTKTMTPLRVRQALQTPSGASNVGSSGGNVQSDINNVNTSLRSRGVVVTDAPYSADATGSVDAYPAFMAAIADADVIKVPDGTYLLNTAPTWNKSIFWDIAPNAIFTGPGTGVGKFPYMASNPAQLAVGPYVVSKSLQKSADTNGGIAAFNVEMIQPFSYGAGQSVGLYAGAIGSSDNPAANVWACNFLARAEPSAKGVYHGIEVDVDTFSEDALMKGIAVSGGGSVNADTAIEIVRLAEKWNTGLYIANSSDSIFVRSPASGRGVVLASVGSEAVGATNTALTARQYAAGADTILLQRNSDSVTTGQFIRAVNAANSQNIFYVSAVGEVFTSDDINIAGVRLSSSGGAGKIGVSGGGTVQNFITNTPFLSATQLGAVPGGVTNTTAALMSAINTAASLGLPLDGGGLTYAVSGDVLFTAVSGINIRNLRLKQLSPNSTNRRTLYFNNCPGLKLDKITIDRNGNGTEGGLTTAAGLWVEGGSGHSITNIEAFGNGKGSGIYIGNTAHGFYGNLYAHNIAYDEPGTTDDRVQGIWSNGNSNCVFDGLRAHDLTGNATGRNFPTAWTRGIVASGCKGVAFSALEVKSVDQGVDVTGGAGNLDCTFTGGTVEAVSLFGVKLANSAVRCTVTGITVNGSGLTGFVANGPAEAGLPNITMDCQFVNCISLNPGSVGSFAGTKAGFRIMQSANNTDYPKGIKFIGCSARDEQASKTMQFGFHCETPYDGASKKLNEVIDCSSVGHSNAATFGFAYWAACATGNADQSIPNATWTPIDFEGADIFDGAALHDPVTNNSNIATPVGGLWPVSFKIPFAPNATGVRKVRIVRTGTPIPGAEFSAAPVTGDVTTVSGSMIAPFVDGANARLEAYQTSGAPLAIIRSASFFSMNLIKAI